MGPDKTLKGTQTAPPACEEREGHVIGPSNTVPPLPPPGMPGAPMHRPAPLPVPCYFCFVSEMGWGQILQEVWVDSDFQVFGTTEWGTNAY